MPGWSFPVNGPVIGGCVTFDEPGNALWFANEAGEIRSLTTAALTSPGIAPNPAMRPLLLDSLPLHLRRAKARRQ